MPRQRREHREERDEEHGGSRPFWSGTISFGLVSVPVELFPASRAGGIALRMLDRDGTHEIDRQHIVRGYELDNGRHVVITDEELEALEPQKSRDIDLERFVASDAIDPLYFERAYFLAPAGDNTKAYRLLADTMEQSHRAGLGTFVMRDKEYWVAIFADRGILRAQTLRFPEEIRSARAPVGNGRLRHKDVDVRRFEKAIAQLEARRLDEGELADRETERTLELIERKQKSGKDLLRSPEGSEEEASPDNVVDLLEVLKKGLRGARRAQGKQPNQTRRAKRQRVASRGAGSPANRSR